MLGYVIDECNGRWVIHCSNKKPVQLLGAGTKHQPIETDFANLKPRSSTKPDQKFVLFEGQGKPHSNSSAKVIGMSVLSVAESIFGGKVLTSGSVASQITVNQSYWNRYSDNF